VIKLTYAYQTRVAHPELMTSENGRNRDSLLRRELECDEKRIDIALRNVFDIQQEIITDALLEPFRVK
jgi:hypothetical protein